VVSPAEHGPCDGAVSIRDLMPRFARELLRSRALIGNTRTKGHLRSSAVAVVPPRAQDVSQMALAERYQIVEALMAKGTDQAPAE